LGTIRRTVPVRLASRALLFTASLGAATACGSDRTPSDGGTNPEPQSDAATYGGCPSAIPAFAPGEVVSGDSGVLQLALVGSSPHVPTTFRNSWTLAVQTAEGAPVDDAALTRLETYMPVHGHAGQPAPEIDAASAPGVVGVEVNFQMRGPWEVRFDLTSPSAGADHVVFRVCVPE
jgi:hypothetical protein